MRIVATNRPTIRAHRNRLKPHAFICAQVADQVTVIGVQRIFFGQVKVIAVFHIELAATHHAKARTAFITEFPLDLIHGQRQIFVAVYMAAEDIGDQLFGGRCEQHITVMAVFDPQHLFAIGVITTAFAPQISGLNGRHLHRNMSRAHLFFMHDVFQLAQHFEPKRQPAVDTGAGLFDHSGPQHIAVADNLRLGWRFFQNRQEVAGKAHGGSVKFRVSPRLRASVGAGNRQDAPRSHALKLHRVFRIFNHVLILIF